MQVVKINVCYWKEKIPGTYSVSQRFPCFIQMEPKEGEYDIYGLPSNEYPGLMKVSDSRVAGFFFLKPWPSGYLACGAQVEVWLASFQILSVL